MKKLVSLLLVLALALGCAAASADDVTGTWYATSVSSGGITVDPSSIGMEMTLTLEADGTASMAAMGESMSGTWTMDGSTVTVTLEGTSQPFAYDGNSLSYSEDDLGFTFERNATQDTFVRPADVSAADITAFDGTWEAYKIGVMGMYMDASLLSTFAGEGASEMDLSYVFENGSMANSGQAESLTFADGMLTGEETIGDQTYSYHVRLLEGGMIEIEVPSFGMTIICVRAGAAELAA